MPSIRRLLSSGAERLKHIATASLDSEVLLSHVLDKPREYLLIHPDEIVAPEKNEQFDALVRERAQHKPIAYLIKQKEFCGRAFFVDERVHIPRPATEDLIDCVRESICGDSILSLRSRTRLPSPPATGDSLQNDGKDFAGTMADIGTGSGCIAIILALDYPQAEIIATDISRDALAVAVANAERHNVANRIKFVHGDLLAPLSRPVDIIVSNPPYGWPQATRSHPQPKAKGGEGWTDDAEVLHQPRASYDGGKDGLDIIKRLLDELPKYLKHGGQAFFEFDPRQRKAIDELLANTQFSWQIKKDLSGFDRICVISTDK